MRKIKGYNYSVTKNGDVYSHFSNRFLKKISLKGYPAVNLCGSGYRKTCYIHRLVAETFIVNKDNKPCVNHIDGDKWNNDITNLEWVTHAENTAHAIENGLSMQSVRKHKDDVIHTAFKMIMDGVRVVDVAEIIGIDSKTLRLIISSDTYSYIRDEYDWANRPNKKATVSIDKVINICKLLEEGRSYGYIKDLLNVSKSTISRIKRRQAYKEVSQSFNF